MRYTKLKIIALKEVVPRLSKQFQLFERRGMKRHNNTRLLGMGTPTGTCKHDAHNNRQSGYLFQLPLIKLHVILVEIEEVIDVGLHPARKTQSSQ